MKVIAVLWRDPSGNLKAEKFDAADFSVKTDPGWLKLIGKDGPIRLLPADKVQIVEFAEESDPPRIVKPMDVLQPPSKFQPS